MADTSDSGKSRVEHTPEEVAEFEARTETIAGYAELMNADLQAQRQADWEEVKAAEAAGAPASAVREIERRGEHRTQRLFYAFLALIVLLLVAYLLFYNHGTDTTTALDEGTVSDEIAQIAPPEPAATPAEVLPAAVFTVTCQDCGEVTQVPLDLNKNAKYQYAYDADGQRLAIFTVMEASEYDGFVTMFQSGDQAAQPTELEGIGDEAMLFDGSVIWKTGEDCGVISSIPKQDAGGEQFDSVSDQELERLARIAAPRM